MPFDMIETRRRDCLRSIATLSVAVAFVAGASEFGVQCLSIVRHIFEIPSWMASVQGATQTVLVVAGAILVYAAVWFARNKDDLRRGDDLANASAWIGIAASITMLLGASAMMIMCFAPILMLMTTT